MPQASSLSTVILRHSGQRCWCFFAAEYDVLIFASPLSGIILAFISTMSLDRRADLSDLDRTAAREQRECQARRGFSQRQMLGLGYNFGIVRDLIRGTRDRERNLWLHCVFEVVMPWILETGQKSGKNDIQIGFSASANQSGHDRRKGVPGKVGLGLCQFPAAAQQTAIRLCYRVRIPTIGDMN
jgi:hypothetical protein